MEKHIFENEIQKQQMDDIGNSLDDFEILQTLGKGSYGFVSKVKSKKNQKMYAMKMIDLGLVNDDQEINLLMNEIKIIQNLNSPHIVKYYNNFKVGNKLYILMEYINNGDIKGYIQANLGMQKAIEEKEIWELLYQSISGLCYIHQNNLIHRDIKPANLFLTDDKTIKIGDFGVSAERKIGGKDFKPEKETIMIGTPLYMSPEIFAHSRYGSKVDVYSLGCTIYELCYFTAPRLPLPGVNQNGEIFTELKDMPARYNIGKYSNELVSIIAKMIEKDQHKRPSSADIFQEVKAYYNATRIQCTSIFCVYRALLTHEQLCKKILKHTPTEKQMIAKKPITCTLDLAFKNMLQPTTPGYPIIFQIRDLLTFNNSKFIDPGEIDCLDLIDYIIQILFMESNHNVTCKSPYLFTEENDQSTFNREAIMSKYLLNFNNFFKSFVSHSFFGTFELNRICTICKQRRTFFENFYYLTLNINSAIRNNLNVNDQNFIFNCFQKDSSITVNKFCPCCQTFTNQTEIKAIFSKPFNIIIYIKQDEQNNISNLRYPIQLTLPLSYTNTNSTSINYNLKAVIQQYIQNGEKSYGCIFPYNQNWYFGNGYNIMKCDNSPYNLNSGKVVMLFYSYE
jgi:NIMA (never in mitosis gene a)-related kinase